MARRTEVTQKAIDLEFDEPSTAATDIAGGHPDPVTLSEPGFDDGGLLRWGSIPAQTP